MKETKKVGLSVKSISAYLLFLTVILGACSKEYKTNVPTGDNAIAEFAPANGSFNGSYFITSSNNAFLIPVGFNGFSDADRTISFTVTSRTAVAGVQYDAPAPVVIKAGQVLDTLRFRAKFSGYPTGRRDTVTIKIRDYATVNKVDSFRLVIQPYCNVDVNSFLGAYVNTTETFGTGATYGPYRTTVSAVTRTSPTATTGTVTITNIWNRGWGPITFNLDWTDPANFTATPVAQNAIPGSNAGDLNSTYAGQTISVRAFAGQTGTFSACNNTFTLKMQLGVTNVGWFAGLYTVNVVR